MVRIWRHPAPGVALAYVAGPIHAGDYVSVPDGRCGLAWVDDRAWWLGPATRPWRAGRVQDVVVGIRLEHVTGRAFAGRSLRPWADARVELPALPGAEADAEDLSEQMHGVGSPDAQAQAMAKFAATRLGDALDPVAVELLGSARIGEPVVTTAVRLGLSVRHLHRRCVDSFGMPPTTLRRILRLHAAAVLRAQDRSLGLAEVAAVAGFADQSHLTREVGDLTMTRPSRALPRA